MDHFWPAHSPLLDSDQHGQRPLLGRLLLVPNQGIIQEQYETSTSSMKTEASNPSVEKYLPNVTSFTENRLELDFLLTPENRRYSCASNESERSSVCSLSEVLHHQYHGEVCGGHQATGRPARGEVEMGQVISQEFQARGKVKSGRSSIDLGRRRSSAYSSDSDRSSWRLSGQFPDTRYSRLSSSDSRRDSETEMELVPAWLKLLRLHKYTELMMGFTYEEMIHLTEEQLEKQGVTKGARRKIITNIQKLLDRPKMLEEINMQLEKEDCNVKKVLTELEVLLKSPVKIGVERRGSYRRRQDSGSRDSGAEVSEDEVEEAGLCEGSRLVDLIMTTLRKTCSLLLLSPSTDVKNVSHFVSLLSVCLTRHCYHQHHKHLLQSWKQKLLSIWGHHLNLQKPTGPGRKVKYQPEAATTNTINSFPISHWSARDKPNRVNRPNRVENTHKPRDSGEREARSCSSAVSPSAVTRKRLSLQNESDRPDQTFHHRYSLPILEPPNRGSSLVSINLDYWDTSKLVLETKDAGDEYLKESSPSVSEELGSEAELDSRLECLCLSVTQSALD